METQNNINNLKKIYSKQTQNESFGGKIMNAAGKGMTYIKEGAKKIGNEIINKAPNAILDEVKRQNEIANKNLLAGPDYSKMLFALLMGKKGDPKNEDFLELNKYSMNPNSFANNTNWTDEEFKKKIKYSFKKLSDKGKEQELKRQILINNGGGFCLTEDQRLEMCYEYDDTNIKRVNYTNSVQAQNKFLDSVRHDMLQGKIGGTGL